MNILVGWLLISLALTLFVIGIVAALRRRSDALPRPATRLMLVFLRLAIGWHFFIEGVDKLSSPSWTSAGYLRESTGPLAPRFRALAGDPVVDRLTTSDDKSLSSDLDRDWQNYLQAVIRFYQLDDAQAGKLTQAVDADKKQAAQLLTSGKKTVETISPYPPSLKIARTIPERIAILHELQEKVANIEAGPLPQFTSDATEPWKTARADVNRWRGDLKKDLDMVNKEMKRTVRQTLLELTAQKLPDDLRKKLEEAVRKQRLIADTDVVGANAKVFDKVKLEPGRTYVFTMESPDMDCYLRLEDGSGIKLAESLGSGRKASLEYKVPAIKEPAVKKADDRAAPKEIDPKIANPDTYRIVAGSFGKQTGSFTLLCKEAPAKKDGKADTKDAKTVQAEQRKQKQDSPPARLTKEMVLWEMACMSMPSNLGVGPFPLLLTSLETRWIFRPEVHKQFAARLGFELAGKQPTEKAVRFQQLMAQAGQKAIAIMVPLQGEIVAIDVAIDKSASLAFSGKVAAPDPLRTALKPDDWDTIDRIKDKLDEKIADEYRKVLDPKSADPLTQLVLDNILAKRKKDQPNDPLPFVVVKPWQQWSLLDWSDHIVKYGIAAVGVLLLVGLFTRLACLVGAGFLLTFFLAMPPLPGWPESPRSEGHYLYINKNIIEMLALLVLATTWSGRWLGLDGIVQFFNPGRWRKRNDEGIMK